MLLSQMFSFLSFYLFMRYKHVVVGSHMFSFLSFYLFMWYKHVVVSNV